MAQSKKISLGFRVVNTRTREVLSETFKKRGPAVEIATRLYREQQIPTGVEHLYDYVAKGTKRTASLRRAVKRAKTSRRHRARLTRTRLRRRISRRHRVMSLPKVSSMSFEKAKAERDSLEAQVSAAGQALQVFPKSQMGGVTDAARVTSEYRAAKARFDVLFAQQRRFNEVFVKTFAKELRAERAARGR